MNDEQLRSEIMDLWNRALAVPGRECSAAELAVLRDKLKEYIDRAHDAGYPVAERSLEAALEGLDQS